MWVRIYSAATGKLLHSWSGLPNTGSGGYTTLAWTDGGRQLAIGYTFALTPAGSKRSWPYLGVRLLNVATPGHNLTTDSRLAWSKLQPTSGLSHPTPLTCATDLQVTVSSDGTVVCGGYGILRDYTPNPFAKTCPAVPDWAAVGFVAYSTATGKEVGPLFQEDTNCELSQISVLWANAAGDPAIGYYSSAPSSRPSRSRGSASSATASTRSCGCRRPRRRFRPPSPGSPRAASPDTRMGASGGAEPAEHATVRNEPLLIFLTSPAGDGGNGRPSASRRSSVRRPMPAMTGLLSA